MTWQVIDAADEAGADQAPCQWPVVFCEPLDSASAEFTGYAVQAAIETLWRASGRQFGICTTQFRPCPIEEVARCDIGTWDDYRTWWGYLPDSYALLHCGVCRRSSCTCTSWPSFRLPWRRVISVDEVLIDGETIDQSVYRVGRDADKTWRLYRVDGGTWPTCQDWSATLDDVDTWAVTVTHGRPVGSAGAIATGRYAAEWAKACASDSTCLLPDRVRTIARQGITAELVDVDAALENGRTGIPRVDDWLNSVNPHRLKRRSRVYRADDRSRRRNVT